MHGHAFRVGGSQPEAELGLAVRVDRLGEFVVFELREVLVCKHQPQSVPAGLGERARHALREMTEAVALIHETEEWWPSAVRERCSQARSANLPISARPSVGKHANVYHRLSGSMNGSTQECR